MAAGQAHNNPPTGIAGEIYSGWIGASGATGFASGITVPGNAGRDAMAVVCEAVATAINNHGGGDHTLGTSVTWSAGTGSGQYSFGAGCPSGTIISITGCDEGGTISFAGGANTAAGEMFRIYFGSPFPSAPAVTFAGADANGASVLFLNKVHATKDSSGSFALVTATAIVSAGGAFHWNAKGRT